MKTLIGSTSWGSILMIGAIALSFQKRALAYPIQVEKVVKNKAVVVFPEGKTPKSGDTLNIQEEGDTGPAGFEIGSSNKRKLTLAFNVSVSSLKSDYYYRGKLAASGTTDTAIAGSILFGYNFGYFEPGPFFRLTTATISSVTTTQLDGGIKLDVNFIKNKAGHSFIPGVFIEGMYRSSTAAFASTSSTSTGIGARGGAFIKAFVGGDSAAVRFDVGYTYYDVTGGTRNFVTTGILGTIGLQLYF